MLRRPEMAARLGLSVEQANSAVATLSGAELNTLAQHAVTNATRSAARVTTRGTTRSPSTPYCWTESDRADDPG